MDKSRFTLNQPLLCIGFYEVKNNDRYQSIHWHMFDKINLWTNSHYFKRPLSDVNIKFKLLSIIPKKELPSTIFNSLKKAVGYIGEINNPPDDLKNHDLLLTNQYPFAQNTNHGNGDEYCWILDNKDDKGFKLFSDIHYPTNYYPVDDFIMRLKDYVDKTNNQNVKLFCINLLNGIHAAVKCF